MRSSVSIALFFLLSGFFLAALLGAVERSRKLLGVAGGCLVILAVLIVILKPVQLPPAKQLLHGTSSTTSTTVAPANTSTTGATGATGSTAPGAPTTSGATGATAGATSSTGAAGATTTAP